MIHQTSTDERTRRDLAVRTAAADAGMGALIIASRGDEFMRGRVQYLSDIFQWAGWGFLVVPMDGFKTFVCDPLGGFEAATTGDGSWVSDIRLSQEPGRELADILREHGVTAGVVGIAGMDDIIAAAHLQQLSEAAPNLVFVNASDEFDDVRAIKSGEEMRNLAETSEILRDVFSALEEVIQPGVVIRDVLSEAHRLCRQHGCVEGIALLGRPPAAGFSPDSTERLTREDVFAIDLEWGGPSGYWLEIRRCFSFGKPRDEVRRFHELRTEVFEACMQSAQPGASSEDILTVRDEIYARNGFSAGNSIRYTAHGIGIDSLEPPWAPGKHRTLMEGMVLSLHPDVFLTDEQVGKFGPISVGDSIQIGANGTTRMTYESEKWVVLDS